MKRIRLLRLAGLLLICVLYGHPIHAQPAQESAAPTAPPAPETMSQTERTRRLKEHERKIQEIIDQRKKERESAAAAGIVSGTTNTPAAQPTPLQSSAYETKTPETPVSTGPDAAAHEDLIREQKQKIQAIIDQRQRERESAAAAGNTINPAGAAKSSVYFLTQNPYAEEVKVDATLPFTPEGKPLAGLVITLDAGHGGSAHQPGYAGSARGVNSRVVEGDINMLVAGEVYHHLVAAGAKVYMTRRDDRKVAPGNSDRNDELGGRTKVADETASHLFLAMHHNATERATADGVVVMTWPTDKAGNDQPLEKEFGLILHDEVEKKVHHKEEFPPLVQDHPLVHASDVPSAIVEFGFITNPEFDAWVSQRDAHREEAIGVYNAVARMWAEHRPELEAKRAELFPDAKPVTAPQKGATPVEQIAKRVARGSSELSPAAANAAISLWKKTTLSDSTSYYVDVSMEQTAGVWKLTGVTNMPQLKNTVSALCEALGYIPLDNQVELLPSEKLGEKKYGIVQIPMAMTWDEPREASSVQTQVILGEPVFLLDEDKDSSYVLLMGRDSYVGWTRSETVRRMDAKEFHDWTSRRMYTFTKQVYLDDFDIPVGAMLPMGDKEGAFELPMPVRASKNQSMITVKVPPPPAWSVDHGKNIAERAADFLTTPYVFGARTWQGTDCSGLISACYAAEGLVLPRDANQQAIVGELVATPWFRDNLRPGDTIYFLDETGKVYHTGISLGKNRFIHCSPPEVQVSSFDPADPLYSDGWTKQFSFGRRPLP